MAFRGLNKVAARVRVFHPQLLQSWNFESLRFFSTDSLEDCDLDFLCSYKASQKLKNLATDTPDFKQCDVSPTPELDNSIQKAKDEASSRLKMENMKKIYEDKVRPELVSRFLIHRRDALHHDSTHWLGYQTHARMKKVPRFTSSYDVMARLLELPKSSWVYFLNYLAKERISVLDGTWDSISTVTHMVYHHAPQDLNGIHFYKGETDASWFEKTKSANISYLIWDNQKIIDAHTYFGLSDCFTADTSEAKAALTLLLRAEELQIRNLVLWTDNGAVEHVLTGKKMPEEIERHFQGRDMELFKALKSKRASFERLIVTRVPRQLLAFVDSMLRDPTVQLAKDKQNKYPRLYMQSANKWAYQLNGLPIFDLAMTADARGDIKRFGKPRYGEATQMKYFIEVAENMKMSALFNIMSILRPATMYLAIYQIETKPENVLKDIYDLMGNTFCRKEDNLSILVQGPGLSPKGSVLVNFDGECLEDGPDVQLTISFCSAESKASLMTSGYQELSASAYIHYHGPVVPRGLQGLGCY